MADGLSYFPMFFDVRDRDVLVVGGGAIALRKCRDLLAAGARVRVVAPEFCAGLKQRTDVARVKRRFRTSDIRGACLVIAATDSAEVNERVAAAAQEQRIPVNVVDQPALSTFIVPAVTRDGPVTVAVSTGGASPALARNLRRRIEASLGSGTGRHARFLARVRREVKERVTHAGDRRRILERLAEDDIRALIAEGKTGDARVIYRALLRETKGSE